MTPELIAQAAAWGCKKHGLINCTQCHEAARVRALEDENERLRAALEAQQAGGEPVYWQWRRKKDRWSLDKIFNTQVFATSEDSEVRGLYTHPAPVQQVDALSDDELRQFLPTVANDKGKQVPMVWLQQRHAFAAIRAALAAQPAAERVGLTDEMVTKAARELCKIHAMECNVDKQDTWNIYAEEFKRDARAMLEAAGITATSGKESEA